ncbi:molecular chaperone [Klebsiella pneumoniae]|uniref:fimbrial biogenesis chaperone n=1 Tax=Klebsiella pneumoniae TaxID=573 RepID=UPI00203B8BC9|nr:molecular chaperone [Klebsiella pneumoniae]USB67215.1 molecular chaperone [Klebsiella pneumoniae]HBT4924926.1 molecular chaperone [Klebsiella pneumoniae]
MKINQYFFIVLYTLSVNTYAGVMPSQSRVIYEQKDKNKSLMLANTNDYPVIVQTWIDKGEGTPDSDSIPFVSIPPVLRLDASEVKGVRIIYNRAELPENKESLFWFNIYEIPPVRKRVNPDNSVLVTMNTQIKLFYRPKSISTTPDQAIKKVSCRQQDRKSVVCQNPTPVHISVIDVQLKSKSGSVEKTISKDLLLSPNSRSVYQFDNINFSQGAMKVRYIDDTGNQQQHVLGIK